VRVQHAPPRGPRPARATDRTGHVVFENLAPGEHHFRVAERGGAADFAAAAAAFGGEAGAPTGPGWQMVTIGDGVRAELRLTKDPAATLRGIVRENGKPLAGARVTFLPGPGSGAGDNAAENLSSMMAEFGGRDGGRASRTGDDGAYELKNLKAGPHRVRVTGKGRAMPTVVAVTLQPGSNEFDLTLDVTIVRGRVLDPQGQPVAGASVTIVSAAPRTANGDPMAQAMEQVMPGVDVAAFGGNARGVKTGDDGRYELLGVQPGSSVQVRASSKAFAAAASEPFEVAANTVREGVDIRLLAAGKVRVTVAEAPPFSSAQARLLGADGEPVRGVQPVMQMLGSGAATLSGLRAGRWRIDLMQPTGGAPQTRTVEVTAGETVTVAF
jgi:hypothetical protein